MAGHRLAPRRKYTRGVENAVDAERKRRDHDEAEHDGADAAEHGHDLASMTFASLPSWLSMPITARCVQISSCIASRVTTIRTPCASGLSSTAVVISYGSTPGTKSASCVKARRRRGTTSVNLARTSLVSGIPALRMNSTCSVAVAFIA